MSARDESFARLRKADWTANPQIASGNDATCKFQTFENGNGTFVYDDYNVVITRMPADLTAEAYLLEFARDPNAAVNHGLFNVINVFTKRTKTDPQIGDIYDTYIIGPDNGSIVLVALS